MRKQYASPVLFETREIVVCIVSCSTLAAGHEGHLLSLCSNTRVSVCQVRHKCIAIPCSAEWKHCGRQVTNLNGARIFRIIQQSHGAAVFPLKIPDAATLESAQHLLGESLLLCV